MLMWQQVELLIGDPSKAKQKLGWVRSALSRESLGSRYSVGGTLAATGPADQDGGFVPRNGACGHQTGREGRHDIVIKERCSPLQHTGLMTSFNLSTCANSKISLKVCRPENGDRFASRLRCGHIIVRRARF